MDIKKHGCYHKNMSVADQIRPLIAGETIDDPEVLETYSKDASIFKVTPKLVVFPKDSKDICSMVAFCSQNSGFSLTPRAAGTCMSGGAINDSLILDMTKYFNKIISVSENSATAQPGVFYRDFEKETLKKGVLLPCYTSSRELNTVGGMVGNNSAGEKSLSYGQTERYVSKVKTILSDGNEYEFYPLDKEALSKKCRQNDFEGNLYKKISELVFNNLEAIRLAEPKTSKNSTGYYLWKVWNGTVFDMSKLIVGSQGTLGIVTEIEFKLVKPHQYTAMLEIELGNLDDLDQIVSKVLEFTPESFECFDDATLKTSLKYLPDIEKEFKKIHGMAVYYKFIPFFVEMLMGQLPKLVLIAEFTSDNPEDAVEQARKAQAGLAAMRINTRVVLSNDEEKYWIIRRNSFNVLRHHSGNKLRTAPFIDDIVVNPAVLPQFLPKLRAILNEYKGKIIYTIAGHIGNGNFHIIPLMDFSDATVVEIIPELSRKVFDLVIEYKGSIAAEHNDGMVRGIYLEKMYGAKITGLFSQVKDIFDPKNIFNPHKKINASYEFNDNHIDRSVAFKVDDYTAKK
ncbi:MAG TPA: FAD-binding oxidoreductase [Patescibacteria group bacterium]|nr:FAD-binding oxidoreductase [Patescibacteria group bacterium]